MADKVNIGSAPDSNTGDRLRTAFARINAAFVVEEQARIDGDKVLEGQIANMAASFYHRGHWTTATAYSAGQIGSLTNRRETILGPVGTAFEETAYVVMVNHTSGVFADDVAAGKLLNTDAVQLAVDLATIGTAKGAAMVAFGVSGRNLTHNVRSRTVESYGVTGTANDAAVMQTAINHAAANNILLTAQRDSYTLAAGVTIPDNFRCDFGNAWIKRSTASAAAFDLWTNADHAVGNDGLDIRNVRFDGQRQANSLTNANAAHRFCGLRLVKCAGIVDNVRADNTVNGEIQAEGNRAGIIFEESQNIVATRLFASGTMGSGVFVIAGKNHITGVWTDNNTGSGFTSSDAADNDFHHIYSDGSGYSGVSINGARIRASWLFGKAAASGFAGVNIGHDGSGQGCEDAVVDNVVSQDSDGWGIVVKNSPRIKGTNWRARNAVNNMLWVSTSPGFDIDFQGATGAANGVLVQTCTGENWLKTRLSDIHYSGVYVGTAGIVLNLSSDSHITSTGLIGGSMFVGGVLATSGAVIRAAGNIVGNTRYGVLAAGAESKVILERGARLSQNTAGNALGASSGVIEYVDYRESDVPLTGTFTATALSTVTIVPNANARAVARVRVWPLNETAVLKNQFVNTVVPGVSFGVTLTSAATGTEIYAYEIF